jgi:hypothetical protein
MIYRILTDIGMYAVGDDGEYKTRADGEWILTGHRLTGAASRLSVEMSERGLPSPHFDVPRARFYFTERGWREVGRYLAGEGRRRGLVLKVIRRKNPRRSQIVYRDALQVAILPQRDSMTP